MRTFELALMAPFLAAASIFTAAPANAAAPTPIPRPSIGGIKLPVCPKDGYIALTAVVQGGKTSVKIGDNVGLVVTITAVNCDFVKVDIDMALGGGLKGDGLHEIGFGFTADRPYSFVFGAQTVQAGTWKYTSEALGYSFGTIDPGLGSGCYAGTEGTVAGWTCQRYAQANLMITVVGPASPTPRSSQLGDRRARSLQHTQLDEASLSGRHTGQVHGRRAQPLIHLRPR